MTNPALATTRAEAFPRGGIEPSQFDLFRDIAQYAPAMLWISNEHGAMLFQNEQYLRFTGLTAAQALTPDSWKDQVHPDDQRAAMRAYIAGLKEQRTFEVEYRLRQHDGCYRNVVDRAHPRFSEGGKFQGYVGVTLDITDHKRDEQELQETAAMLENRSREMSVLYELKSNLQVCLSIAETRPVLLHYGEDLFGQRTTQIYLHNNSRDLVEPFVSWPHAQQPNEMFGPEQCWALRKGKVHVEHTRNGKPPICPHATRCAHESYLCIPMAAFGETIGIIQVDFAKQLDGAAGSPNSAVNNLQRIGAMAADEIGTAIEELKLRERLRNQSIRDPLTLLFNRRYFIDTLEREIYRAQETQTPLALLFLDLDHFKRFNDTHGHSGGDLVLKEFAKVLQATVRGGDVPCRYGGEEFAVLMLDCPPEGAMKRAEEIRVGTERITTDYHGTTLSGVTTSIGVACFPIDANSVESLITKADTAVYSAKAAGRNCVVLHSTAGSGS